MCSEDRTPDNFTGPPADQRSADAGDLVLAALDYLRGVQEAGGSPSWPPSLASQEARLLEWADGMGLLLSAFKITDSAYYRREDNLGVFDAHDKNLVRAGDDLIPFDVIPCHPAGGFLAFIEETLAAGHRLRAVRTVTTSPRTPGPSLACE